MGLIKNNLENLKDSDILNFVLFTLYKLHDTEEYGAISELAYILDKTNLFRLCEYYGGLTITIPTISQLEILLNALLLYKYIDIDNHDFDNALSMLRSNIDVAETKKCYFKIREVLSTYEFSMRGKL